MQYLTIGDTDIPALGFGTWMMQGRDCRHGVEDALSIGYRHIDTAQIYENEDQVGRALNNSSVPRGDIFLTTKVWRTNVDADSVAPSVHESLQKLDTDYVDLLLIHWPVDDVAVDETLRAMEELQQAGKARHLGVSNFPPSLLKEAIDTTRVITNQVEYHPFLGQRKLLQILRAHDMMLTAYSPLARGRVLEDETLVEIGNHHGKSPAQVALRWLIEQPGVCAIPKASSPEHRRDNLAIFDFELTGDEMARIDELDADRRILDPDFGPDWER